ncbi:MAG: CRISPR-associated endonuclease Cas2 [Lentisphaeria bacterium]|nr:CRISPR-associated endonuclease Cas2 [Lentisphaeria bacterium]
MFLVIYDIAEDKLRTKFSKFLERYGQRIQYSVFKILNSQRILDNVRVGIKTLFQKKFDQSDSVMIIQVPDNAITDKFGYAQNDESDLLIM